MTIHVNIGEAKTRLSQLVAAAVSGEDVVLDKAGAPQVRLMRVVDEEADRARIGEKRRTAMGLWHEAFQGFDTSIAALKADHADPEERFGRKFGTPD